MIPNRAQPEGDVPETQELFLMRLRYREGRLSEAGANKSFLLDDAQSVWVVYSGKVDLFTVRVQDHQPAGPRHHLLRVPSGQAFFGMETASGTSALGLLAVGTVGTRLLKIKRARLQELAQDPLWAASIVALMNEWVVTLGQAAATAIPPKACQLLDADAETKLAPDASARAHKGVLWVRHREGHSLLMGRGDLSALSVDGFFPLSKDTWVKAVDAVALDPVPTDQFLVQDAEWKGLDRFHAVALEAIRMNALAAAQAESLLLRRRMAEDGRILDEGVSRLAAVLPVKRARAPVAEAEGDPLLMACRWLGAAQGIAIRPPPERAAGAKRRDPLGEIAKASRVRLRQVVLKGEWWRHESGPLLGYWAEKEQPVALLPAGRRKYELRDPVTGTRQPVTAALAQTLSPTAFMFYRPLPGGVLTFRQILSFGLREAGGDLNMVLLMGTCTGLLAIITPYASGLLIDTIIPTADRNQLLQITLALVTAAIGTAMFSITQAIAVLRLEGKMDAILQSALWDRLLNLPVPFFRQYTAGDLASRALGISYIRQILTGVTINSVLSALFSVFNLALMFWYNATLAWVGLGLVSLVVLVAGWISYIQMYQQRNLVRLQGLISGVVLQLITGVSKLRVASGERRAFAQWAERFAEQKKLSLWTRTVSNYLAAFNAIAPIATTMTIFYSIYVSPQWNITAGSFVGFNAAFGQFLAAMLGMNMALVTSLNIIPLYERLKPILETVPEVDEAKADPGNLTGEIEVSNVSFRYTPDGPLVLRNVSLTAKPGEFVAVVGPSGSGKSTLFRLLLGFEKPEEGGIYFDGQDLASLDIQAVRRQIGVVLQHAKLMTGDIFTNIIGSARLTIEDAWEAARMSGLDEDIQQMPMGMYTIIMEGGGNFSGGQRQRLLIARAIATKPRILLFDEATSALDNRTQATVSRSLETLQATRFVIAHRHSTIVNADRIYVIVAGQVAQTGTYAELLNQPGPFADLVKRQMA